MSQDIGVVLPCAGSGTRVGASRPKQFLDLGGRPVFHRPLTAFLAHPKVRVVVLVVAPSELHQVQVDLGRFFGGLLSSGRLLLAPGGTQRWESVRNGVRALPEEVGLVVVHDVARPFLTASDIDAVVLAAQQDGAATLAMAAVDTVKRALPESEPAEPVAPGPPSAAGRRGPLVESTLDRSAIWLVQTPQAFRRPVLESCYGGLDSASATSPTDEAGLVEGFGHPVRLVRGAERLRKITSAEDLEWARWMVERKA